jgi:hypothetical protein
LTFAMLTRFLVCWPDGSFVAHASYVIVSIEPIKVECLRNREAINMPITSISVRAENQRWRALRVPTVSMFVLILER